VTLIGIKNVEDQMGRKPKEVMAQPERPEEEHEEIEDETYELVSDDEVTVYADFRKRGKSCVSINGNLGRIVVFAGPYHEMLQAIGKDDVEYVKLISTAKYPGRFWIIPVESKEVRGARGLHKSGNTIMISAKALISALNMNKQPTKQYYARWEPVNGGILVDLRKPLP
jgi:hypothetical protein